MFVACWGVRWERQLCGLQETAGEGNRTLVFSLEGYCSTIELHPRAGCWADTLSRPFAAAVAVWVVPFGVFRVGCAVSVSCVSLVSVVTAGLSCEPV